MRFPKGLILALPTVFAVLSSTSASAIAQEFTVESCNDGDTCRLKNGDNLTIKVRLVGLDAPEFSHARKKKENNPGAQPYAEEAKSALNDMVKGKSVKLKVYGTDAFNRNLAEIYVGDKNVNLFLVKNGFAEQYHGKAPKGLDLEPYRVAEDDARKAKKGIWGLANYQSPAEFRKKQR